MGVWTQWDQNSLLALKPLPLQGEWFGHTWATASLSLIHAVSVIVPVKRMIFNGCLYQKTESLKTPEPCAPVPSLDQTLSPKDTFTMFVHFKMPSASVRSFCLFQLFKCDIEKLCAFPPKKQNKWMTKKKPVIMHAQRALETPAGMQFLFPFLSDTHKPFFQFHSNSPVPQS